MFWILLPCFILLDVLWWLFADARLRRLPSAKPWRILQSAFMLSMIVYLLLSMFYAVPLRRSGGLPVVVHTFVYLWHFIALPMLAIFLAVKSTPRVLAALFFKGGNSFKSRGTAFPVLIGGSNVRSISAASQPSSPSPISQPSPAPMRFPTRRQVLAASALAIPPLATAIVSEWSVRNLYGRRLTKFDLRIPTLPRQLDGMTIAHVSDTHIGKFLNPDRLPGIAEDINKLDADFIAFTGDLIDLALDDLPYGIDFLRKLKSRCGMVICEGNHDIMQNRGDFEYAMRDAGLPLILGGQQTLYFSSRTGAEYPVQFLAVPWNMNDDEMGIAVDVLRPEVNPNAFPILLAHHPHSFDAAAQARFPLVLSGHTHGGQIMLTPQFGAGSIRFRYTSGLYQKPGSSLIVNNGLGNWFPLRINAPAELVHITLRSV